ncbi:MAG: anthranilate phosphoribosyltransferase [Corynebacteriales bacterium]|nr:anthranilate phosphoribosyltransferase [Mycobacteriales bacterium]
MNAPNNWPALLTVLLNGENLTPEQAAWAMQTIMTGEATDVQIAGFAVALRAKGVTPIELAAFAQVMVQHATPMPQFPDAVDIVGTGGDQAGTANISTMAAVVIAAAGVPVVKHGNRAASSLCGSADLLEELGVAIDLMPEGVVKSVEEAGIGFCFAPRFHTGYRHAAVVRRALGVPTVFNFLGPLTNPAQPQAGAIGCADVRMAPIMAGALAARGASALVLRGHDGLDEFTLTGPTEVWAVSEGSVRQFAVTPADIGVSEAPIEALKGGDASVNARIAREVFEGTPSPISDAVIANAAAALVAYHRFAADADIVTLWRQQVDAARNVVASGAPAKVLERWVVATR